MSEITNTSTLPEEENKYEEPGNLETFTEIVSLFYFIFQSPKYLTITKVIMTTIIMGVFVLCHIFPPMNDDHVDCYRDNFHDYTQPAL